ncbi:MAG: hypothetical protein Q9165_000562 [Trypethelium subeluteriae]
MDTPCIPGLHENLKLRREAINKINEVFSNSKITLICDRDIMEIDVSDLTLGLQESILAAFLVCDWNVRAWTLLEAARGVGNLHLLCKDNKLVSVNEILKTVHAQGSIDIAILFADAPHLLPIAPSRYKSTVGGSINVERANPHHNPIGGDYINVERAAHLLSHRYATREDDEVVIWSLLCNERAFHSAEDFWRMRANDAISTGFLMSSIPRLKDCPGLTWAPLRPNLQEPSTRLEESLSLSSSKFSAFDGQGSDLGVIRDDGFHADWLVHFIHGRLWNPIDKTVNRIMNRITSHSRKLGVKRQISKIIDVYLRGHQMGALLRPKILFGHDAFEYRGKADGPLLAVVGSDNGGSSWCWKGIYEWHEKEPLPKFEVEPIVLV